MEADMAILDEIDSRLDIDARQDVAKAINNLLTPHNSILMITHYQRLLDFIRPSYLHIMIVEFITVLLGTGDEIVEKELVSSKRILSLFFEYPLNNSLHHHVESIIISCMDSKNTVVLDHLFNDCKMVEKFLQADKDPGLSADSNWVKRDIGFLLADSYDISPGLEHEMEDSRSSASSWPPSFP